MERIIKMENKANQMTLATFNIRTDTTDDGPENGPYRWSSRFKFVKRLFEEYQWDIVGLQEVKENQLLDLLTMADYESVGEKRSDNEWGEYNPILYNKEKLTLLSTKTIWLSKTPEVPSLAEYWGAENPRICTTAHFKVKKTGKELVVLNTHFDHIGEEARYQSSEIVLREIVNDHPTFLMGDLNGPDSERFYKPLSNHLSDVVRNSPHHVGPLVTCTGVAFSSFPTWDEMLEIDYIFANEKVEVIKTATVTDKFNGLYPSDHFPISLWCELI